MASREDGSESKVNSLVGIIKKVISFDPVFALIAILVIIPLAPSVVEATVQMNDAFIVRFLIILCAFMVIVYLPLLIVKANISREDTLASQRNLAVEEERKRREERERNIQSRINAVVEAKLNNINLKTQVLFENSKHFEKYLIHEAAKELKESMELKFGDSEEISNLDLNNKFQLVVDGFDALQQKIAFLEESLPDLEKAMSVLGKEASESLPEIQVNSDLEIAKKKNLDLQDKLATAELFIIDKEDEIRAIRGHVSFENFQKNEEEKQELKNEIYRLEIENNPHAGEQPTVPVTGQLSFEEEDKYDGSKEDFIHKYAMPPGLESQQKQVQKDNLKATELVIKEQFHGEKPDSQVPSEPITTEKEALKAVDTLFSEIKTKGEKALQEALKSVENMSDDNDLIDAPRPSTPLPEPAAYDSFSERIENTEKTKSKSKDWAEPTQDLTIDIKPSKIPDSWSCKNCERHNPVKAIRCRVCGKSKSFVKPSE